MLRSAWTLHLLMYNLAFTRFALILFRVSWLIMMNLMHWIIFFINLKPIIFLKNFIKKAHTFLNSEKRGIKWVGQIEFTIRIMHQQFTIFLLVSEFHLFAEKLFSSKFKMATAGHKTLIRFQVRYSFCKIYQKMLLKKVVCLNFKVYLFQIVYLWWK